VSGPRAKWEKERKQSLGCVHYWLNVNDVLLVLFTAAKYEYPRILSVSSVIRRELEVKQRL